MDDIHKEKKTQKKLTRRNLILLGIQAAGVTTLAARAKFLQIDQNDHYLVLAEGNRLLNKLEPAPRGIIFDAQGRKVADNVANFRALLLPEQVDDAETLLNNFSKLVSIGPERKKQILQQFDQAKERNGTDPVSLVEHLMWEEFALVSENLPSLPGIQTQTALSRVYPYHRLLAHEVGYVGRVSQYNLDQMEIIHPIYKTPNMAIGKSGIEAKLEIELRGKEGLRVLERNVHQRIIRELDHINPAQGSDVQLTLNAGFQNYAAKRLEGESASAVVIDVENGDVKLLISSPSFDPNLFVRGISTNEYKALNQDIRKPFGHKAVSGQYPPGSTFKMVTALAALEAGVSSQWDSYHCSGKMKTSGRDFHCWKRSGHGSMNLKNSLKHSCDVYYYRTAEKVGIDKIAETATKLGLGIKYDLEQSAVQKGLIPNRAWKKERYDQDWVPGDSYNSGIGQGYVLSTPLQLAVMTARLATNKAVLPRLIAPMRGKDTPPEFEELGFSDENLAAVRGGMYAVSNETGGTAYRTRINADGAKWAGKTGTAQVRNISKAERESGVVSNADLDWARRDHALFVAFAPYDKPKYAISIVVEHGGGGSSVAAPLARDLMLYAMYNGPPPIGAYPASARANARIFMASVPELEDVMINGEIDSARETASDPSTNDDQNA